MRYLSAKDIKRVFSMRQAIDADKEALSLYSNGKADVPLRTNLDALAYNGQNLYMPGYTSGEDSSLGIKIVSVYPDNPKKDLPSVPSTMITQDATTGIVNAILDGTYLTQLRTGAVQGAATELLSRKDSKKALLIGTGGQAMTQLEAMLVVRDLTLVYISDLKKEKAESFAQKAKDKFGEEFKTKFIGISDPNKVVPEVDIITTVTTSKQATFDGKLVKAGTHINGIGAYTPQMCEIPLSVLKKATHIYTDTNDGVFAEAGDIIQAFDSKEITKEDITGELGQLVNKTITGRVDNEEITIFKTVGSAVLDTVVADKIVKSSEKLNIGMILN